MRHESVPVVALMHKEGIHNFSLEVSVQQISIKSVHQ